MFSEFNEKADELSLKMFEKLINSQKSYQHLFNTIPFPIVILDSNGIIIDANITTEKAFDTKKEEFIGKSSLEVQDFSPEIFNKVKERQELLLKGKSVGALEVPIVLKDGSKRWISSNISLFHLEGKVFFQIIIQDITDRKDSKLKLKESETKLRNIFEAIPDLYFIISRDTTILDYRGNIEQFYIAPESFMGKKISEIMPNNIGNESLMAVQKIIKTKEPQIIEYDLEMHGKTLTFESRHLYLNEERILIFIRDITERKKAQQKLIESENDFRDLYEEAPNAYFSINPTGNIRNCNKAAEELLGYSKKELFKTKILDLYAPNANGKNKARELFKTFLKGIEIKNEELQMRKKNGELIWINLSVKPILDNVGKVIESRSVVININDRKIIEQKVEEIARFPFENPSPVLRVNLDEILYINHSAIELFHVKVGDKTPEYLREYIEQATSSNLIKEFDLNLENKVFSFVMRPIEEFGYVNLYGRDITKRKIAEEELKASEENYRKAYNRVTFYKDLFAHDLNNVLQSILSSVELYSLFNKDIVDSKKIEGLLEIINDSALRGAKLISNVQKLSKLEDSTLVIFSVNLRDFLKEAINFTKNKYQNREISIKIEGNSKINNVQANELLLDVFENILINAVNYNDNEKVEIFIKITEVNMESLSYIKMEFIDNGIGIEDARKEKIFKVGNREFKGSRGMGMGLSLVKNAIESFGGKICIRDKVKGDHTKGSKFILIMQKSESKL